MTRLKADLENALQQSVIALAYPHGDFDSVVQSQTGAAGFQIGCSATSGLNTAASPSLALHRIEIEGTLSLARFVLALWLGSPA